MTQIKDELIDFNPWWKKEFRVEYKEREIYKKIKKVLPLKQIVSLTGLRRVGKTTIMLKIVEDYIKDKFDPKRIVYFSFDEFKDVRIREVIDEYEKLMNVNLYSGRYIILFDEIQKVNDWENQIKTLYDVFGKRIKIIISGSESLFIRKGSKETLGGRIFEFKIDHLSFKEYIVFKNINYQPISLYRKELLKAFDEYIKIQGFPEMVGIKDKYIIKKYIKESIVEKVIYRDIPQTFKVRDPSILESIINVITEEPGQIIEISSFANHMNISRQTLSDYLNYLEKSYLIQKLYNYSKNRRKVERKLKKFYPTVNSVDLCFKKDNLSRSRIFESIIINLLDAKFFWRDPYKNEVDAILLDKKVMPIEIKYGKIDTSGLIKFMDNFGLKEGWILSYDTEKLIKLENKIIYVIPAYKFFLGIRKI